ncbi:MAG: type II secretion system protein GspJ [Candidatus Omnitrophota bacterium]
MMKNNAFQTGRSVSQGREGFTLVEALIVVSLFAMLGLSLSASFATGLKVWKRAAALVYSQRQPIIGLERLALELRRAVATPSLAFTGSEDQCSFPNVLSEGLWNISYRYDAATEKIYRSAVAAYGEEEAGASRSIINHVENFTLSFYGYNPVSEVMEFMDTWSANLSGLPKAVRVTLQVKGGEFEKVVLIPAGQ